MSNTEEKAQLLEVVRELLAFWDERGDDDRRTSLVPLIAKARRSLALADSEDKPTRWSVYFINKEGVASIGAAIEGKLSAENPGVIFARVHYSKASLVVAAPRLLEVAREMLEGKTISGSTFEKARSAIALADDQYTPAEGFPIDG